jgi:AcrR family transcriptional regulator
MAKQIEGVYERILESAKKEFLDKGYIDASLRTIAANAGTSTNSIYVRFRDKEGLFSAIVEPVMNGLLSMFRDVQETFHNYDKEVQRSEMGTYSENEMMHMIDYIYDHMDTFHLLLDASHGTKFQNFVDEFVRVETEYTYKWLVATGYKIEMDNYLTRNLLHIVNTSYFEGIFEVIRHDMEREEAKKYVNILGKYNHEGFRAILNMAQKS